MNNSNAQIAVVIPSNRYRCIKEILEKCILPYKGKLFAFEIHDSSEDCQMENLVLHYAEHKPILYFKYSTDML